MKPILLGSDHGGFAMKEAMKKELARLKLPFLDFGAFSGEERSDYPVFAHKVARAIAAKKYDRGILVCGTGIGVSIAANRHKGIRATLCLNEKMAEMARAHNDSNILVLGGRITTMAMAKKILHVWLTTKFLKGRHLKRIKLIEKA